MDPATLMTCIALTVYDGDTVRCDGQLLRPMGPGAPSISGFDTPEIGFRADCEKEDRLGRLATTRMEELVKLPGLQIEDSGEIDRFDRPLVWLRLPGGRTLGQILLEEGHAREWRPGKNRSRPSTWCNFPDGLRS